ncbi:MAG: hypothetical protein L6Q59_11325 [Ignavibacteriaceae bacterium]|nr:hypothetical protein [Ignavibacteriaceae bacterium]
MNRRDFLKKAAQLGAVSFVGASVPTFLLTACDSKGNSHSTPQALPPPAKNPFADGDTEILIRTFLGNETRRFYGKGTPKGLNVINKFYLDCGRTIVGTTTKHWCGAGWTGQPTIIKEKDKLNLVIGAYDHNLRRIDVNSFKEVWKYKNDDVMKGSSSVYIDETAPFDDRVVVLQGSRLGKGKVVYSDNLVPSLRAVSFRTGKELWKLNVPRTECYSRDNDSSPIYLGNGMLFNAVESGFGMFMSSKVSDKSLIDGIEQPKIFGKVKLYNTEDVAAHGNNIVVEASPARLDDMIYIASGAGHIYGIDINKMEVVFDFFTGTDIDGTTVISKDGKVYCALEKQYVPGQGGILKLNPLKPAKDSVEWFFPTKNTNVADWQGGVIGTCSLNDDYNPDGEIPRLFATLAIDGNLYVGSQDVVTGEKVNDTLMKNQYDTPVLAAKAYIGASISTPIFTEGNKIVAPTYNGLYLYQLIFEKANNSKEKLPVNAKGDKFKVKLEKLAHFNEKTSFEATPVVWDGLIYQCCRDGYLYQLG